MATFLCTIKLFPNQTGQTLTAAVYDSAGSLQTTSDTFTELGRGEYIYKTTSLADNFIGYVKFSISGTYQTGTDIDMTQAGQSTSIATLTTNLATANTALSAHTTSLSTIAGYTDSLETSASSADSSLSTITTNLATANSGITNLDTEVDALTSAVAALSSSGLITVTTPFVTSTDLELIKGDSYSGTTKLTFSSDAWNLTTQTLSISFLDNQTGETPTIATTLAITSTTSFSLSIVSAATDSLSLGSERYSYSVRATVSGESISLVRGFISVLEEV